MEQAIEQTYALKFLAVRDSPVDPFTQDVEKDSKFKNKRQQELEALKK